MTAEGTADQDHRRVRAIRRARAEREQAAAVPVLRVVPEPTTDAPTADREEATA